MFPSFGRLVSVFIFTAVVALHGTLGLAQNSLAKFRPKQNKIKKIVATLNLLAFTSDGKGLKPIVEASRDVAGRKFGDRELFSLPGFERGDLSWSRTGVGGNTRGGYGFGRSKFYGIGSEGGYWLFVEDYSSEGAALRIESSETGQILLDYKANDGSSLFRFRQQSKGGLVFCQRFTKGSAAVASGKSYDDFCRSNPEFVRKQLTPLFEHIGLGAFPNRYADEVVNNVLAGFRPFDAAKMEEFQSAIVGLDAESFAKREAAMSSLEKNAKDWRRLIQLSIVDDQYSVETRNRLKNIFENSLSKQEVAALEFATKGKLADDPLYLIWMLEESESGKLQVSSEVKKILASKLGKMTGENHGDDLTGWSSWLSQSESDRNDVQGGQTGVGVSEPFPAVTNKQILEFDGPLEKAGSHIGKLVRLKVKGGDLVIDRDHWARSFGGKSIEEVTEKARAQLKELNLPGDWFAAGGRYAIESAGYPQVLFEAMASELPHPPLQPWNLGSRPKTADRAFAGNELKAFLKMRTVRVGRVRLGGIGIPKLTEERSVEFDLQFSELTNDFCRKVGFNDAGDGAVTLSFEYPAQDALIQIIQQKGFGSDKKDHFVVFDIRGPAAKLYRAKSFAEFRSNNPEYFASLIKPLLGKLKIVIED